MEEGRKEAMKKYSIMNCQMDLTARWTTEGLRGKERPQTTVEGDQKEEWSSEEWVWVGSGQRMVDQDPSGVQEL